MKELILAIALVVLAAGCSQTESDYRPEIRAALTGARSALADKANFVYFRGPEGKRLVNLPKTLPKLANAFREVDVTQCPRDFRLAWIGLVHTMENYQFGSNLGHGLASGAAVAVAWKTGSKEAGNVAAREFEEVTTQADIKFALQHLETVCLKYGVQPSAKHTAGNS